MLAIILSRLYDNSFIIFIYLLECTSMLVIKIKCFVDKIIFTGMSGSRTQTNLGSTATGSPLYSTNVSVRSAVSERSKTLQTENSLSLIDV